MNTCMVGHLMLVILIFLVVNVLSREVTMLVILMLRVMKAYFCLVHQEQGLQMLQQLDKENHGKC